MSEPTDLAQVVRRAAANARAGRVDRAGIAADRSCTSNTPADRNAALTDALLRHTLPPRAPGVLQHILDRALDTLYIDQGLNIDAVRSLLAERRDPDRRASTAISQRTADAIAYLSVVVAACEDAPDTATARALIDAGLGPNSLLSGRTTALARRAGGRNAGDQRAKAAEAEHNKWEHAARRLIASGSARSSITGILAQRFGVTSRAIRDVLQERGVLEKRK